ncbi:MAG: hypothetical protein ACJAVA_000221 [Flavobacteriaceae bacterium]|jgi:hypothetical protein
MNSEHKRISKISADLKDNAVIKASDKILVIVSNKDGLWTLNGNLGNNKDAANMMQNIIDQLNKTQEQQSKN